MEDDEIYETLDKEINNEKQERVFSTNNVNIDESDIDVKTSFHTFKNQDYYVVGGNQKLDRKIESPHERYSNIKAKLEDLKQDLSIVQNPLYDDIDVSYIYSELEALNGSLGISKSNASTSSRTLNPVQKQDNLDVLEDRLYTLECSRLETRMEKMEEELKLLDVNALKNQVDEVYVKRNKEGSDQQIKEFVQIKKDMAKYATLLDSVEQLEDLQEALPLLVDRLGVLQQVHLDAATISQRVAALEEQGEQTDRLLERSCKMLALMENAVKENTDH